MIHQFGSFRSFVRFIHLHSFRSLPHEMTLENGKEYDSEVRNTKDHKIELQETIGGRQHCVTLHCSPLSSIVSQCSLTLLIMSEHKRKRCEWHGDEGNSTLGKVQIGQEGE